MSAAVFVPIAEECGLITEIGNWVVDQACQVAQRWQSQPATEHLITRINLSARQLSCHDVVERMVSVLDETRADPRRICLELTETTLMADAEASLAALSGLRDLGFSLAIDDFGTGYSSLAYLKLFPVDILKIDRSFVSGLPHGRNDVTIVSSLIRLANALELDLVAEGVETVDQASALVELGCGRAQGYLYGRPVPLDEFSFETRTTGPTPTSGTSVSGGVDTGGTETP